jgi:flagellar biosynthesis chaperone FliJ
MIMNKLRRKQLDEIIEKIQAASEELESIMNDEEEYRDNMPENLQGSEKYETADAACESMQEAIDQLEEAVSSIESAQE